MRASTHVILFVGLKHWALLLVLFGWFQTSRVQTFQPIILIYNTVHWRFTSVLSSIALSLEMPALNPKI